MDGDGIDDDEQDEEAGGGGDKGAGGEDKAASLERRSEQRGERIAMSKPPEPIEPLAVQRYMLQCQIYQAKELPSADAQGASDPFAVVRCGRNQAGGPPSHLAPHSTPRTVGFMMSLPPFQLVCTLKPLTTIGSFIGPLVHWFIHWSIGSFIGPFIGPFIHSLVHSSIHWSIHWSIGPITTIA